MPDEQDMVPYHLVRVFAYSGHEFAQRPVSFVWKGDQLEVREILSQWEEPRGRFFRLNTEGDKAFQLYYSPTRDEWCARELP